MEPVVKIYIPAGKGRMRVALPYDRTNRRWLHDACGRGTRQHWDGNAWELARSQFRNVADAAIDRYGAVLVIKDFYARETCRISCLEATSDVTVCECQCLGEGHGKHVAGGRHWTDGDIVVYHDYTRRSWIES
jgi:hypothetical protein